MKVRSCSGGGGTHTHIFGGIHIFMEVAHIFITYDDKMLKICVRNIHDTTNHVSNQKLSIQNCWKDLSFKSFYGSYQYWTRLLRSANSEDLEIAHHLHSPVQIHQW